MLQEFVRTGPLREITSYPAWAQEVVHESTPALDAVLTHELVSQMRDGKLASKAARRFLLSGWQTVEQFPQFMAMSLTKVRYGRSAGEDKARRYLCRNILVEQRHAEQWVDWASAHDLTLDELRHKKQPPEAHALSHWCGHVCVRDSLAVAMAATNYAVEGITGQWTSIVCSSQTYELTFAPEIRTSAMRWLRVHAHYDDAHPWEAIEIVAMLLGTNPAPRDIDAIRAAITNSYEYTRMVFDYCLE